MSDVGIPYTQEKLHKDCIAPKNEVQGSFFGSLGVFLGNQLGTACSAHLDVRSLRMNMLKKHLIPVVCNIRDSIGDLLFQKDNAAIHKVKNVTEWLESVNVDTMEHSLTRP